VKVGFGQMQVEQCGEVGSGEGREAHEVKILELLLYLLDLVLYVGRFRRLLYLIGQIVEHQAFPHGFLTLDISKDRPILDKPNHVHQSSPTDLVAVIYQRQQNIFMIISVT
jgi:hypothetical protein